MSLWQNAIDKICSFSNEHRLLVPNDRLLIGISGGPDSVFVAEILAELAPKLSLHCHLAHINYGMRNEESDADQELVENIAKQKGWQLDVLKLTGKAHLARGQENFQDWARNQRYRYFREQALCHRSNKIVVAHHLTDQIETFLLRLLRGSGPSGLAAMRPNVELMGHEVIRPLLSLTRKEIIEALDEKGIPYRHDSSNDSIQYRRNQLRHEILPLLAAIQPGFERSVGETLLLLQGEDQLLNKYAKRELEQLLIPQKTGNETCLVLARKGLQSLPKSLRLRVLRLAIGRLTGGPQSITFHHVRKINELVCDKADQAEYDLPGNLLYEQGPLVVQIRLKTSD